MSYLLCLVLRSIFPMKIFGGSKFKPFRGLRINFSKRSLLEIERSKFLKALDREESLTRESSAFNHKREQGKQRG